MRLHSVRIKNTEIKNNVWLAPLAGYTNAPLRKIALESGAGFCFTEMVSAKGLCYGSENTKELLSVFPEEKGRLGVQIFGNDPVFMRRAAESEALAPFAVADINMGCPVPKIYKNGELYEAFDLMSVSKAYTIDLEGNKILVEPEGVSVKEADCPDRLCVKQGRINMPGHSIVCLPNRVVIEISDGESGVDAVAGAR